MSDLIQRYDQALMHTFGAPKLVLDHATGTKVWDVDGNRYTDFLSGIAVSVLGHCHPAVTEAVSQQLMRLDHVSNFFASAQQVELAEVLQTIATANDPSQEARVFLANSGTEANEAAFKLTRLTGRKRIIAMEGSFHGRTMGALALTSTEKYRLPFEPLPGDVTFVPYGDAAALRAELDSTVAAVILEPIQGEHGVIVPPAGYLAAVRDLTSQAGALLWVDEVQTGWGRCGEWLVSVAAGVTPDIITLAKGMGNGFPIGACIGVGPAAELFTPGLHGSTFGGNPVAAAAALAVHRVIVEQDLLAVARQRGAQLQDVVRKLNSAIVKEVRGQGLLVGIELTVPVAATTQTILLDAGWIINAPRNNIIRLAPPAIVSETEIDDFGRALGGALALAEAAGE